MKQDWEKHLETAFYWQHQAKKRFACIFVLYQDVLSCWIKLTHVQKIDVFSYLEESSADPLSFGVDWSGRRRRRMVASIYVNVYSKRVDPIKTTKTHYTDPINHWYMSSRYTKTTHGTFLCYIFKKLFNLWVFEWRLGFEQHKIKRGLCCVSLLEYMKMWIWSWESIFKSFWDDLGKKQGKKMRI